MANFKTLTLILDTHDNFNKAMESVIDKFGRESIFLGGAMQAMSSEVAPTRISFTNIPDL